jgi:chromosomal replication initiator protein
VVQHPGKAYNPLFIHGSVGLGKTHLIQAVCHALLERKRDTKVLYLNCESFTNDFIHALEHTELERFRNRYRYLDILVVDDIHFLANKDRTQEEFFHTFNTLYNAGKQIVLSSDSPPGEIPTLENRLVSRFRWGMVAEIEKPVYETRFSIVRRKARTMGVEMPEDAARFIAETVDSNIRELEGNVVKVVGSALIMERPVTLPLVKEVLRNADNAPPRITMEEIINATTRQYQVKVSELQSKKRTQSITLPRQICMFLARQLTGLSLEEIGGYLGGRDHTTVMYAVERVQELEQKDQRLRATIAAIRDRLGA